MGRHGAPPMYCFGMAKALSAYADVFCIVSSQAENLEMWHQEAERNKRLSFHEVTTYNGKSSFILNTLNFRKYKRIAQIINQFQPDILYSPFNHFWTKFIFPLVNCSIKVTTIHDIRLHVGEDSTWRKLFYGFFDYRTDRCVILSDVFREHVIKKYHYRDNNVVTIPHATYNQYADNPELDLTTHYKIIFFGRIIRYKGLDILLKALKIVVRDIPNLQLLVVGNGDITPYQQLLQENNDNVQLHVRWIKDNEVSSFFEQSDMAVLPYIEASQTGIVPIANHFGKPTIVSDLGGLPYQVEDYVTGRIVPPNNPEALARAIIDMYSEPEKLKEYKINAYKAAQENSWDKSARLFIEGFTKGLSDKPKS